MPRRLPIRPGPRADLTPARVLEWADAFRARHGRWPSRNDGTLNLPDSTWSAVDQCLKRGLRGLPPGSSLAKLLKDRRGRRHKGLLPRLSVRTVLAWADTHLARTGDWPTQNSGRVEGTPGETWAGVNRALEAGGRGLAGGTSLARLLADRRGVGHPADLPRLTEELILAWADAQFARTGRWPTRGDGPVPGRPDEEWSAVDNALKQGRRGLPGGSSLARLLAARRGARHHLEPPRLAVWEVLVWADAHAERTGAWPTARSGPVAGVDGETWAAVEWALTEGTRGLPGGDSLARLLERRRGRVNPATPRPLTVEQVLAWADAHQGRTGRWPGKDAGPVAGAPGETWQGVNRALYSGRRGLPGGSSLARLLEAERGARNVDHLPRLTVRQVLAWADAHRGRTGRWPTGQTPGPIPDTPGETWRGVDVALRRGHRGLGGGSSLARLLAERRDARNRLTVPGLTQEQILAWAVAHFERTGGWPAVRSGTIEGAPGETWSGVNAALAEGLRGLPGGDSLARLLARHREGGSVGPPR